MLRPAFSGDICYRAVVTSGACPPVISDTVEVEVFELSDVGTVTIAPAAICETDNVDLEITGNVGATIRWEEDLNCAGTFAVITAANDRTSYTHTLPAGSHCIRVRVINGACPADISTPVTVDVTQASDAGNMNISANAICIGDDITLGAPGPIVGALEWQEDPGCTGTFTTLAGSGGVNPFTYAPAAPDTFVTAPAWSTAYAMKHSPTRWARAYSVLR